MKLKEPQGEGTTGKEGECCSSPKHNPGGREDEYFGGISRHRPNEIHPSQKKKKNQQIQRIPSGVEVKSLKYIEVATLKLVWWGLGGGEGEVCVLQQ